MSKAINQEIHIFIDSYSQICFILIILSVYRNILIFSIFHINSGYHEANTPQKQHPIAKSEVASETPPPAKSEVASDSHSGRQNRETLPQN